MFTFVFKDEVRPVAGDVVVGGDADLDVVGGRRVDNALPLGTPAADRQLTDAAASARRQLLSDECVQRAARSHIAGRPRAGDVEVVERQSYLSSVVGLDRPRAGQAAAPGGLRHQIGQVPNVPAAAVRGLRFRRGRHRNSARKWTTSGRLLD